MLLYDFTYKLILFMIGINEQGLADNMVGDLLELNRLM